MLRGTRSMVLACAAALFGSSVPAAGQQSVQLPARDRQLAERPAHVFTAGRAEGESWEMFAGVRGVAFDAADNLYVLDGQAHRVIVFDGRGRFVREFGRRGGGPGELQGPISISVTSDGNVVVSDLGNRAWIVFRPTGEHVRNVSFGDGLRFPVGMFADRRGGVLVRHNEPMAAGGSAARTSSFVRQPLDGSAGAVTLFAVPVPAPRVLDQPGARAGETRRMVVSMDPVFSARPTFGPLPDGGLAVHHETEYAVKIVDGGGRHVRTITRAIRPRRVTRRDQDAWRERQREGRAGSVIVSAAAGGGAAFGGAAGGGGQVPTSLPVEPTFAEVMSVVSGITTDPHGRVWVQRRNADGTGAGRPPPA
jgi:hypothetical protein